MSMQTKIAFKVEEIKNRKKQEKESKNDKIELKVIEDTDEKQQILYTDDDDEEEEEEEKHKDINPFFREPLYVGNLCLPSNSDQYYRWIVFISTSSSEIIKPKSIQSVTYILHPTYRDPKRTKTKSPFFLDLNGWGIFTIDIVIKFKNNFIRPFIETTHMLSVDAVTSITCIEDGSKEYHNKLYEYLHFKQFKNEKAMIGKPPSFVKKVSQRLKRNLMRTPSPVYFQGFSYKLPVFTNMLKQCISTDNKLIDIFKLNIPDTVYDIIGYFAVFSISLYNILPNQEVFIEECQNSNIVISAPKFNHLRLRRCNNITIKFPYIMSKCELIECENMNIICTDQCYTYRFDQCNYINVTFPDPGSRVTMLSFDSPSVTLNAVGIQWKEINEENEYQPDSMSYCVPYKKGENERLSVRWRGNNVPGYTSKAFHAKYTLGSSTVNT